MSSPGSPSDSSRHGRNAMLVACDGCGRDISVQAAACPHCGHPNRRPVRSMFGWWAAALAAFLAIGWVSGAADGSMFKRVVTQAFQSVAPPGAAQSESAKLAIAALKRLEARTEIGITYRDYIAAVGEANFPVKLALEEGDLPQQLAQSLGKAIEWHRSAAEI